MAARARRIGVGAVVCALFAGAAAGANAQEREDGAASAVEREVAPAGLGATRYPAGSLPSPLTEGVVSRLRAVLARGGGRPDVFAKIGDSNTSTPSFLRCFTSRAVRLGERGELEATRAFFARTPADGVHGSFDRVSSAAKIGWLTHQVLGPPAGSAAAGSPLATELAATRPGFAVVMLGTNDNRPIGAELFAQSLRELVDRSLAAGVVPLLTTIPPRADGRFAAARVPGLNAVVRAVAEERQVPLVDLFAALDRLPPKGLMTDGVHLASFGGATPRPCDLGARALQKGMNVRNLLTLEALDRMRRFVILGEPPEREPAGGERFAGSASTRGAS